MQSRKVLRRILLASVLGGAATVVIPGCSGLTDEAVAVTVVDSLSVSDQAATTILAVVPGACPASTQLEMGEIVDILQWVDAPPQAQPFTMRGFEAEKLAFIAIARADDCTVLGYGCTPADLSIHENVTVAMNRQPTPPAGACDEAMGDRCEHGFCRR